MTIVAKANYFIPRNCNFRIIIFAKPFNVIPSASGGRQLPIVFESGLDYLTSNILSAKCPKRCAWVIFV